MKEPVPLATIQAAILELLRGPEDAVLLGAQAVNAYCDDEPRMTQDVDVLALNPEVLAEEIRARLSERFQLAIRVRELSTGRAFRVFQLRKPRNRHLAAVRRVETLPPAQRIDGVLVVTGPELIARKLLAYQRRKGRPKSGTDWRDLAVLLLAFQELKAETGPVLDRLHALDARPDDLAAWRDLVHQTIEPEIDDDEDGEPT